MKKVIAFSLLIIVFLGLFGFGAWIFWLKEYSPPFVVPLPYKDPTKEVETLLREKKIDFALENPPHASDSAILFTLANDHTRVLFSAEKDIALQVGSLQIILNKLTIEGRNAKTIDLRFEDPVVVY